MFDRLTKAEAEELLAILAAEFKMPAPKLRWSLRSKRGRAYPLERTIAAGPLIWRGATNCLLHEFAHLLAWKRWQHIGHRGPFIQALRDVTTAWHGDADKYDWASEYKSVAAAGPSFKRKGGE